MIKEFKSLITKTQKENRKKELLFRKLINKSEVNPDRESYFNKDSDGVLFSTELSQEYKPQNKDKHLRAIVRWHKIENNKSVLEYLPDEQSDIRIEIYLNSSFLTLIELILKDSISINQNTIVFRNRNYTNQYRALITYFTREDTSGYS